MTVRESVRVLKRDHLGASKVTQLESPRHFRAGTGGWHSGDVGYRHTGIPRIRGAVWCRSGHHNTKYE